MLVEMFSNKYRMRHSRVLDIGYSLYLHLTRLSWLQGKGCINTITLFFFIVVNMEVVFRTFINPKRIQGGILDYFKTSTVARNNFSMSIIKLSYFPLKN